MSDSRLAWSERQRITVPGPVPDHIPRPELIERIAPTDHGIVVLNAPGGFGKTALLAECCRELQAECRSVAWLRVDRGDDRETVEAYLALAMRRTGIADVPDPLDLQAWNATGEHLGAMLHAVEHHDTPCVLAIDDLDRLTDTDAINALGRLMRHAPPNLHFAVACRELPTSLDISEQVLAGRAELVGVDELRFSKPEINGFFHRSLSRTQLASLTEESAGWPVALHIFRHVRSSRARGQAEVFRDVLGNWLETRLWQGKSTAERDFLLDIGLFDRLDPELIDEVLGGNDMRHRLAAMRDLAGLIERDDEGLGHLHKMVREHCIRRRYRESPERFRSIHRRAARALARRGETVDAMRHAAQAGDAHIIGEILEGAGGLRFWLLEGPPGLADADPYLSHEVIDRHPRLALARCVLLLVGDRVEEAKRVYDLAADSTGGFTRNPTGDDCDIRIDHCLTQAIVQLYGCRPLDDRGRTIDGSQRSAATDTRSADAEPTATDLAAMAQDDGLDSPTRSALEFGLCIAENQRARFDAASEHARRSRRSPGSGCSPYLDMHIDFELGSAAMAQGLVEQAATWYARGLKTARANYPHDAAPVAVGHALLRELALERNKLSHAASASQRIRDTFQRPGNTFAAHAAESAVLSELAAHMAGEATALESLAQMWEYARRTNRVTLARYLSALRVSLLAAAGDEVQAELTWSSEGLPARANDCLAVPDWREMEALCCARLRLFAAREAFEPGREFARALLRTAKSRRLVRMTMRGLAIAMSLEEAAGNADAACGHLGEFLRLYAASDYARPLAREGENGRVVLNRLRDSTTDDAVKSAAESLLGSIGAATQKQSAVAAFSAREMQVLGYLADSRDKQIAERLRISHDGVRYHVRRIFAKLGARNRHDAVYRARAIGLIP